MKNFDVKSCVVGLIIGGLMMVSVPSFAKVISYNLTKSNYTINVNGEEYKNNSFPIMNYNNITYIPITALSNIVKNESTKQIKISNAKEIILKVGETYSNGKFSIKLKEIKTNPLTYTKLKEKILIFEINSPKEIQYPKIVNDDMEFGLYKLNNNQYSCIYNSNIKYKNPYIQLDNIKLIWDVEL